MNIFQAFFLIVVSLLPYFIFHMDVKHIIIFYWFFVFCIELLNFLFPTDKKND